MKLVIVSVYYFIFLFILHISTRVIESACDLIKIRIGVSNYGK